MTLRGYLTMMIIATMASAASFGLVIWLVDPYQTNLLGFLIFYGSLFLTIVGLASIIGFIFRFVILKHQLAAKAVVISFRQAFLMAFLFIAVFLLFAKGFFTWLNLFAIVIGFASLEFFLLSLTTDKSENI